MQILIILINYLYFKHQAYIHKGLGNVYGQLHVFIEERENPEETSEEEEKKKEALIYSVHK